MPEANLPALKAELDKLGLDYEPSNFRKGCVTCTGIEFCNLAVAETKNRMIDLVEQLEDDRAAGTRTKSASISAAARQSAASIRSPTSAFAAHARKCTAKMVDAYDAFIGGRLGRDRRFNELLKGKIIAKDVHLVVDSLLKLYASHKQGDEIFSEFLSRSAKEDLLAVLPERYRG